MKNNNMGGAEYTFFNERVKALLDSLNGYLRDNYQGGNYGKIYYNSE